MLQALQSPAQTTYGFIPGQILFLILNILGLAFFAYIVAKRLTPLLRGERDFRFDRPLVRLEKVLQFWLGQWKHPRYRTAGIVHILIFTGFIVLATRAFSLLILGISENLALPDSSGGIGHFYEVIADYAATVVFLCMVFATVRRIVFRPARYEVPANYGKSHKVDAIFLLSLIAILMFSESLFEASKAASLAQQGHAEFLASFSLAWVLQSSLSSASHSTLWNLHSGAYLLDVLTFYFLLCYRPFGIQFHVETSLFNVYFAKLDKGTVKPVRWGVSDEHLDQVKSFGVKTFEDFTWKHMLDFYSCADCGRCSDNCPANSVGRPLSPRFISIKARDYSFQHYPMFGSFGNGKPLVGDLYSEDEIWSCTTCGACEEECPLLIEYIDKIVDLRRGLVDDGNVPKSIQKALKALESRGNPYGKMEKKRADWTKVQDSPDIKVLNGQARADTLYFVDSITSYDDRIQAIGRATARILKDAGEDFGILGASEKDSGHDVRRFGEETLFMALRDHNVDAIKASGVQRIVTADPHAYNALKHDYRDIPPVEHISQVIARELKTGKIRLTKVENENNVYAYHDPCYLGRHNQVYDDPRDVLDAIPGLKRVEMSRCRDRSFCCGGGGLMLFYEPKEEQRMGVKRVQMAAEAGANVIVTACPFCMVNMEDAIKVAGMEGKMTAIDLAELVDQHIAREGPKPGVVREEYVTA
ncbi:MAG: (Fe-S)-binding protein [Candidatus Korobacteraceae bacterium]